MKGEYLFILKKAHEMSPEVQLFLWKANNVNHPLSLSTFPVQGCVPEPIPAKSQQKHVLDRLPVHHRVNTDRHTYLTLTFTPTGYVEFPARLWIVGRQTPEHLEESQTPMDVLAVR